MSEPEGASNDDLPEPCAEELAIPVRGDVETAADRPRRRVEPVLTVRQMPQAPEAEKAALSCFLLMPREVGALFVEKRITPEHFYDARNGLIYGAMMMMFSDNEPIDFITVTQQLRDLSLLDKCGGAGYTTDLFTFRDSPANASHYLDILHAQWTARRIVIVGTQYASQGYEPSHDVPEMLQAFERDVLAIGHAAVASRGGYSGRELATAGIEAIERRLALGAKISGLSTGFHDLDNKTDGMHRSELIVIAGLSGTGKSALAMQIIEHQTLDCGVPCAVFTLEMGRTQLAQRCIYTRARVNPTPWRDGIPPTAAQVQKMTNAAAEIASSPLYVEDASDPTIQGVRATARRLVRDKGVRIVVIDSLSALHSDTRQGRESRVREAAECTEGAKQMAKELNITVIMLCHIARTKERNERPNLNDLRETGKVEQDADSVWMLYEPEFDAASPAIEPEIAIWIPKQRDGDPFVTSHLRFQKFWTRFYEPAREQDHAQAGLNLNQ